MTLKQLLISLALFSAVLYGTILHYLPLGERDITLDIGTLWQTSSVNGDADMYLRQVDDFALSTAPYRYRVLPTLIVRAIDSALNVPPIAGYVLLNCLSFMIVGVGFTAYLMRWYSFSFSASLLGGVLVVTTVSLQSMMLLPMGEPISYVAALAVFWALHTRRPVVFAVVVSAAILTKEIFIVLIPLYALVEIQRARAASSVFHGDSSGL